MSCVWVGVDGSDIVVEEGGAKDLLHRLAHVYLGPDAVFPPPAFTAPGYVTRIEPESVGGIGSWAA